VRDAAAADARKKMKRVFSFSKKRPAWLACLSRQHLLSRHPTGV
jgi:hypothetical protein